MHLYIGIETKKTTTTIDWECASCDYDCDDSYTKKWMEIFYFCVYGPRFLNWISTTRSFFLPLTRIFFILFPTVVQFHFLCLNWYWHSTKPILIPSLIPFIIDVSLQITASLLLRRCVFLQISAGSNNTLLPSAL